MTTQLPALPTGQDLSLNRKLTAAVGPGQKNFPTDVTLVRGWLNALIDGMFLVPLAKLDDSAMFDERVKFSLHEVERRYFYGLALPKGDVEPGSSMETFLRDAATGCVAKEVEARLTSEMYGLASVMVPGGADRTIKTKTATGIKAEIQSGNIRKYLPDILKALEARELADLTMLLMSFGTIRAETSVFGAIDEGISKYNTSPKGTKGRHAFDLYDDRDDLGNTGAPDGSDYKGRGFVQLTGRANYQRIGVQISEDLENNPAAADDPKIAAEILAQFLKNQEAAIRTAFAKNDLAKARRLVNGGSHGLSEFTAAIGAGRLYLHLNVVAPAGRKAATKHAKKKG